MSKQRSKIGAWAADVEQAEEEERAAVAAAVSQSSPKLKEVAGTAKSKNKRMSLNEFHSTSTGGGFESRGLTPDERFRLPTGPKERSEEEMQYGRLGSGFSNYGRTGPQPGRMRDREDSDGSWGGGGGGRRQFGGGYDDDRRGPSSSRVSDYDQPSRADEVDSWARAKKSLPSYDSGRQSRYGSLGGGGSRADEVDNWAVGKKPLSTPSSTFGSGFRDSGPESDRRSRGAYRELESERPRLVFDSPSGEVGVNEPVKLDRPNPFGTARPREDVLAEKGLDWKKREMEIEAKKTMSLQSSRPTSAHSSRPSSAQSSRSEGLGLQQQGFENVAVKPRPKVNPFGEAKPRELLLQERGQDWRKIDRELEHRGVDRPETEEEKLLKEEIEHLKKGLEKELTTKGNQESPRGSADNIPTLREMISEKERELEILVLDLDDKVRFGSKAIERPGSGAGRASGFSERPPSRSGSFDESRNMELMDRPRSHGKPDIWTRPVDDRRAFQGGRERGFLGSRDFDRLRMEDRC